MRLRTRSQLPCLVARSSSWHLRCHLRVTTSCGVQHWYFLPLHLNVLFSIMAISAHGRTDKCSNQRIICKERLSEFCSELLLLSRQSTSICIWTWGIVAITLSQKLLACSLFWGSIFFGRFFTTNASVRLSAIFISNSITTSRWSLFPTCSSWRIPILVIALDCTRHVDTIMWSMCELPIPVREVCRVQAFFSGCRADHADVSDLISHRELSNLESFFSTASMTPVQPLSFHGILKSPARMILTLSPSLSIVSITSSIATSLGSRLSCFALRRSFWALQEVLFAHGT